MRRGLQGEVCKHDVKGSDDTMYKQGGRAKAAKAIINPVNQSFKHLALHV